ncbi:MAG TPA: ABC transporter substrate-binding protein [Caldilineaceae bacterium]|nr:ABC transporter substrate-binding protein [Caldilineaceae bacterium]
MRSSTVPLSRRIWLALLLLVALVMSACAAPAAPASPAEEGPAGEQAATGAEAPAAAGGALYIARPTDAVGLDPKVETTSPGNWVMSNIYENLVKLDTDMTFKPVLAESWEQIEPDRWRFTLRQGVKFHDGTDFNAEAVKFSIERIKNPDDPGRSASNLAAIVAVEVVDDYTVDIVTDGPYGPLLNAMSLVYATGIVSPAAVEQYGEDFTRNPVGTGPFRFVEWSTNDRIVLERNPDYWGEPAKLDQVVYRVIPEESARMLALDTGEVQMVMAPAPSLIDTYRDNPDFTVHEVPGVRVVWFGMMTAREPLSDVRLRQALNFGVDRQAILDNVLEGMGYLPQSYISPSIFGFTDISEAFAYDPERAAALLEEAGWVDSDGDGIRDKDGEPLTLVHFSPRGRYLKDAEIAEAYQAAMRELGVDIQLEIMEWGTLFEQVRQPNIPADLFTLGWSTATGDAEYTLEPVFGSKNIPPTGWNSFEYQNPEFDALVDQADRSTDPEERAALYAQAQEILAQEVPAVPIYNSKEVIVTSSAVQGFTIHPIDYYLWLAPVSLAESAR